MREIKFRAWNKDQKKMFNNDWLKAAYIYYWGLVDSRNIEPMQWTGLRDKNGKEVYENDIVKDGEYIYKIVWAEHTERGDLDSDTFIVGWVREWRDGMYSPLGYSRGFQGEVIGNIYEHSHLLNPELLTP